MPMRNDDRDPFTGYKRSWQAARIDEEYLDRFGNIDRSALNWVIGESPDISAVSSMAAIYGYSVSHFRKRILPSLDFVIREKSLAFSYVSSLTAHAEILQAKTAQERREVGRKYGTQNLINRISN